MIKNFIRAFTIAGIAFLMIMTWGIITDIDQVKEDVIEIKEDIIEIKEDVKELELIIPPFDLENSYHCLASNIYWEARNQSLEGN